MEAWLATSQWPHAADFLILIRAVLKVSLFKWECLRKYVQTYERPYLLI
jgi:hypothetical protein